MYRQISWGSFFPHSSVWEIEVGEGGMPGLSHALVFFFLWRGRKCTRLGPYNCVSCENLSEKDPKGPYMANPFTTKQTTQHKHQRPANPPARFAFRRKSNSKTTQKRGRAQQKHTQRLIAMKILLLVNSIENQKHANELPCGRSAVKRSATADKIQ